MHVLLVSPAFHGYAGSMGRALEALGHRVSVHAYDRPVGFTGRLGMRLLHQLPEGQHPAWARTQLTGHAVRALRERRPDVVVVVKGDQLGDAWWDALAESPARRVTWFYDELRRMRYTDARIADMGPIATYSPEDTAELRRRGISAIHVPLGHDTWTEPVREPVAGVSFIGARYPSRENTLRRLAAAGVPVKAFGRDWAWNPVRVRPGRAFAGRGIAAGRDLDRARAYGAMRDAWATLNLHSDQDGFTMRTFEAPGVGAVQVCDRPDVERHYDVGSEVLVFTTDDELVDLCGRVLKDRAWADRVRERGKKRTLAEHTLVHRMRVLEAAWA